MGCRSRQWFLEKHSQTQMQITGPPALLCTCDFSTITVDGSKCGHVFQQNLSWDIGVFSDSGTLFVLVLGVTHNVQLLSEPLSWKPSLTMSYERLTDKPVWRKRELSWCVIAFQRNCWSKRELQHRKERPEAAF